ncbi:MAG: cytochrome P450, partial [Chloroflexi bacterium]|nr:cytochrome P450 [Chloroflexota bacterium]
TNSHDFIKHRFLRMTNMVLGNGLLTSEGSFWLRQRRLAQPAFHRQRIAAYGQVMAAYTQAMLDTWQPEEVRDVHHELMQLTMAIVAKTLFDAETGTSEAGQIGATIDTLLMLFESRLNSLLFLPDSFPTPTNLRLRFATRRLDRIIYRFIRQHRATGQDQGDLMSLLLQAQDADDGSRMTDRQVRDEVMTLFLAGHETTALTLSWVLYLLARHPDIEVRLLAEQQDVLGPRLPTMEDLPRLPYTEMVLTEALRLYPPAYVVGREALRDYTINGLTIPRGTTVLMSQWVVQRDERFFEAPEQFRPERWAGGLAKRLPRYAYFPFGGGPRLCIGQSFALMEATILLVTILQRFRLTLAPDHPVVPWTSFTLRPKHGIQVVLHRR